MNTVGPTMKTKSARTTASTMLVFDSHWMPLATPETAEATKAAVSTAMMATSAPLPSGPTPPTISRPLLICSAPRPSEVAEPKRVAKIAKDVDESSGAARRATAEERGEGRGDQLTRPLR